MNHRFLIFAAGLLLVGALGFETWRLFDHSRVQRLVTEEAIPDATVRSRDIPALRAALLGEDFHNRYVAARVLAELGPTSQEAVPDLATALKKAVAECRPEFKNSEYMLKRDVVPFGRALMRIGKSAQPTLEALLDEPEVAIRLATVMALNDRANPNHHVAVPVLRKGLHDTDSNVRFWACGGIGDLGCSAKDALPDLLSMRTSDSDANVRGIARIAAITIQRERVQQATNPEDREAAARSLKELVSEAEDGTTR